MTIRENETFVFGSNIAGRHGKGAALTAALNYGAIRGQGRGLQGRSYAIPTKDAALRTLPLPAVDQYIGEFIEFAKAHPEMSFYVTPVGCGLAGFNQEDVFPLFEGMPGNCRFAETWLLTVVATTDKDHNGDNIETRVPVCSWDEPGEHQVVLDAINGVGDDE